LAVVTGQLSFVDRALWRTDRLQWVGLRMSTIKRLVLRLDGR